MLKITTLILLLLSSFLLKSEETDFITFEWLTENGINTGYGDHVPHFRRLFHVMKVRGFLECGCGYSTKYFLENAQRVVSVEFIAPGVSDQWFLKCIKLFRKSKNWVPLAYNADLKNESFNKACGYQCATHQDYALIDAKYLTDLDELFKKQLAQAIEKKAEIDVALVDPGIYIRGDMVKVLLANNVPVVVANGTNTEKREESAKGLYGWFKVETPPTYTKITIPFGQGTTFWIKKSLPHVIKSMEMYRKYVLHAMKTPETCTVEKMKALADK